MNEHIEEEFNDEVFAEHDRDDWLYLGFRPTYVVGHNDPVLVFMQDSGNTVLTLFNDCTLKVKMCCSEVTFRDAGFSFVCEMVDNIKGNA